MIPACQRLYDIVVHQQLIHPDDEHPNRHVHAAVAGTAGEGGASSDRTAAQPSTPPSRSPWPATSMRTRPHPSSCSDGSTRHCLGCHALIRSGSYCTRCSNGSRGTRRWKTTRSRTRVRDGQRCVYCGYDDLTVDLNPALEATTGPPPSTTVRHRLPRVQLELGLIPG